MQDPALRQGLAEAVAALVGEQGIGFGQSTVAVPRLTCPSVSSMIRSLPSQTACSVDPASGASDTAIPFSSRLAAVR